MRRKHILELITRITGSELMSEDIVMALEEEGVLHLGYGDPEVDLILDTFKDAFSTTKASKQDRWAAHRLAQKYGAQAVVGIIKALAMNRAYAYAPVVNNVAQMETKMVSILNFLRSIGDGETIQTG